MLVRFGQQAAAILMTSSIEDPMQFPAGTSLRTPDAELRSFIHSYTYGSTIIFFFYCPTVQIFACPDIFTSPTKKKKKKKGVAFV